MAAKFCLGPNRIIGENQPTFVIAEIGQNHQGSVLIAKHLIKVAKECGADCVKFQKTYPEEKFTKHALNQPYSTCHSWGKTYGEHKKHLEFSEDSFHNLQAYARELGILFTASAMDLRSLDFLVSMNMPFIKIGSGDSNNLTLIEAAARKNVPLVISTGMLNLEGVTSIYNTVIKFHKKFAFLHCVSSYPTPLDEINLKVITLYKNKFPGVVIGYSGHELEYQATLGAVALGANIVERHITLDKSQKGSDHACSLEPKQLKLLISDIRKLEVALGTEIKCFQNSERVCYEKLGKTLVAARNLKKGDILEKHLINIKVAVPKGMDGSKLESVLGRRMKTDIEKDGSISEHHLE